MALVFLPAERTDGEAGDCFDTHLLKPATIEMVTARAAISSEPSAVRSLTS